MRIWSNQDALTEGEGAARLFSLLGQLNGQGSPQKQARALRYSMRGRRDLRLIRNFLWREGFGGPPLDALRNSLQIVDVRHALMVLAAVCRARETGDCLPRRLRDYDLDPGALTAAELCDICGVAAVDEGPESSALYQLIRSAREAAQAHRGGRAARDPAARIRFLAMLGDTLDHLAGVAAMFSENSATKGAESGFPTVLPPAEIPGEITPSHMGLLLCDGAWTPVVRRGISNRNDGARPCLYALPEGRPLQHPGGISRPLLLLDFLASHSGWDAAADKRLRRLCGRLEAADSFRSLRDAFMQRSDGWTTLPSAAPAPSLQANRWTQLEAYAPSAEQYVSAGKL